MYQKIRRTQKTTLKGIYYLAYPRALLPSGGPLSREFWQLTTPVTIDL